MCGDCLWRRTQPLAVGPRLEAARRVRTQAEAGSWLCGEWLWVAAKGNESPGLLHGLSQNQVHHLPAPVTGGRGVRLASADSAPTASCRDHSPRAAEGQRPLRGQWTGTCGTCWWWPWASCSSSRPTAASRVCRCAALSVLRPQECEGTGGEPSFAHCAPRRSPRAAVGGLLPGAAGLPPAGGR